MMNLMFVVLGELISKLETNVWEFEIISFFLCLGNTNRAIWHYDVLLHNDKCCQNILAPSMLLFTS